MTVIEWTFAVGRRLHATDEAGSGFEDVEVHGGAGGELMVRV
jgi:hypothetical protein